nr:hypothetical protein [Nostoc parmelioides]
MKNYGSHPKRGLNDLAQQGHRFSEDAIARLSPYLMGHIIRFRAYNIDYKPV